MGTGIRVADINQIKQYAEEKEYEKALVLIRQQDLSKTFNSQFARICGEVLLYTKNYEESRFALINAHKMAPEGNRINYDLICLYLETGEYALADKYYEQYVFNAGEGDTDLCWLNYYIARSKRSSAKVLYEALEPLHTPERSDIVSYEFLKIYQLMGEQSRFDEEYKYFKDTFKDSEYKSKVEQLVEHKNAEDDMYIYPAQSILKHDEQMDSLEETLLEQDYYRMYPKEPEIVLMADDYDAQGDQAYMLKIAMDKWSQKRKEKASKRAAAKAERKQAKQDKKEKGEAESEAAQAGAKTESEPEAVQTEAKTESEAEAVQAEAKTESEQKAAQEEAKTESEAEAVQTEAKTESEAEAVQAEAKTESEAEAAQAEAKTEIEPEAVEADSNMDKRVSGISYGAASKIEVREIKEASEYSYEEAEQPETYEPEEEEPAYGYEEAEQPEAYEPEEEEPEYGYEETEGPEVYEPEEEEPEYGYEEAEGPEAYEPEEEEPGYGYEEAEQPEEEEPGYGYEDAEQPEVYEPEEEESEYGYEEAERPEVYEPEEEAAESEYAEADEPEVLEDSEAAAPVSISDKHRQMFDDYDALLKQEEEKLNAQFEREALLLREAESLLASVQTGVNDWNSKKVNNLFEAFDMDSNKKMHIQEDNSFRASVKADKKDTEQKPDVKVIFENSFETVNEHTGFTKEQKKEEGPASEIADFTEGKKQKDTKAQETDVQTGSDKILENNTFTAEPEKPHVELREHMKNKLTLDVRKKEILQQLKERR